VERQDILKKLAEGKLQAMEIVGLPPFKCQQVVAETLQAWEKLSMEKLVEILEKEEF